MEDGILVVGDNSWSIDMQRFNFQFTAQRFFRIRAGRLDGQLKDVVYQATTTDFWGSMVATGGEQTYLMGGAFNCGKGTAGTGRRRLARHARRGLRGRERAQQHAGGRRMTGTSPQEVVERALALSRTDGCIVLVHTVSTANLRWARSTLTTNGETTESSVTVIAIVGSDDTAAAGSVTRSGLDLEALPDQLAAARASAEHAGTSPDARPLVRDVPASVDWDTGPGRTSGAAFAGLAPDLGELFASSSADAIEHFGFASHSVLTTYLGTSTGLAAAARPARGPAGVHRRSRTGVPARPGPAPRAGTSPTSTSRRPTPRLRRAARLAGPARPCRARAAHRGALGERRQRPMIDLYWSAVGRDAAEGRSVFSAAGGRTRVGEPIATRAVSLTSGPDLPGIQCAPFVTATASSASSSVYDNGLPVGPTAWIDAGTLAALITTRSTAAEHALPVRPGIDNLRLDVSDGTASSPTSSRGTASGLLVTCLWYNRVVDPQTLLLTGLTRDGVYVIEGGEVVGATTNFRFNDSPVSLLGRVTDAGATGPTLAREMGDYFNRSAMPPLQVSGFNFSTVSQAS